MAGKWNCKCCKINRDWNSNIGNPTILNGERSSILDQYYWWTGFQIEPRLFKSSSFQLNNLTLAALFGGLVNDLLISDRASIGKAHVHCLCSRRKDLKERCTLRCTPTAYTAFPELGHTVLMFTNDNFHLSNSAEFNCH